MTQAQNEIKAKLRIDTNRSLLAVCFTIFGLIISLRPSLFHQTFLIPIQLTIAVPLLISSIFARSRIAVMKKSAILEGYGYVTFLISYAFLVNIIGILLANVVGIAFGLTFLIANMLTSYSYSIVEILAARSKLPSRIRKDLFFTVLLILGGVLPALGWY